MPSQLHEVLVELFRNCGELAPELLRLCADLELDHDHVEDRSIDLSQLRSTEYRADAVIELCDRDNARVAAVIVEVQLDVDPDKQWSWPVYVPALRARLKCPVILLVLTPRQAVAQWASRPIDLGHPGYSLTPVVISFGDVPRLMDLEHAMRLPELAVLSTMANPEIDVAATAIDAITPLPEELRQLYSDIIFSTLPDEVRQTLERRMIPGYKWQSEFFLRHYRRGHEEGLHQGLEQGREQGLRAAVRALARSRFGVLAAEDEAVIEEIGGESALTELLQAVGNAGNVAEAVELAARRR